MVEKNLKKILEEVFILEFLRQKKEENKRKLWKN